MALNKLTLRQLNSPWGGDVTKNTVLSFGELDSNFIHVKGKLITTFRLESDEVILIDNNGDDVVKFPVGSNSGSGATVYDGDVIITPSNPNIGYLELKRTDGTDIYIDLKPMAGKGLTSDQTTGQHMLDLGTTLPQPEIHSTWEVFDHSGSTVLTSQTKHIEVAHGSVVDLHNSYYIYTLNGSQVEPLSISGDWGNNIPGSGNISNLISHSGLTTNTTFVVDLHKPSSGLVVVNNHIEFATGDDTKGDSTGVMFVGEIYHGHIINNSQIVAPTPTEADVLSGLNFLKDGDFELSGVVSPPDSGTSYSHHFVAYPMTSNQLTNIILVTTPIFGAYTKFENIMITNSMGYQEPYYVYVTDDSEPFNLSSTEKIIYTI